MPSIRSGLNINADNTRRFNDYGFRSRTAAGHLDKKAQFPADKWQILRILLEASPHSPFLLQRTFAIFCASPTIYVQIRMLAERNEFAALRKKRVPQDRHCDSTIEQTLRVAIRHKVVATIFVRSIGKHP